MVGHPGPDRADPRRSPRWRARLVGAALVALVVSVLAQAVAVQRDRQAAAEERAGAVAAGTEAAVARAAVQGQIDELAGRFAGTRGRLAEVRTTAEAHRQERAAVDQANGAAQAQRDAFD